MKLKKNNMNILQLLSEKPEILTTHFLNLRKVHIYQVEYPAFINFYSCNKNPYGMN